MGSLVVGDFFEVIIEGLIEPSLFKVLESEVGETLAVEFVLYDILDQSTGTRRMRLLLTKML
jgi:hypothetical protein